MSIANRIASLSLLSLAVLIPAFAQSPVTYITPNSGDVAYIPTWGQKTATGTYSIPAGKEILYLRLNTTTKYYELHSCEGTPGDAAGTICNTGSDSCISCGATFQNAVWPDGMGGTLGPKSVGRAQWSRDGTRIVFSAQDGASTLPGYGVPSGPIASVVDTSSSGDAVTWVSGTQFPALLAGQPIKINGVTYTVMTVNSATSLTLTSSPGNQTGVAASASVFTADPGVGGDHGIFVMSWPLTSVNDIWRIDSPNCSTKCMGTAPGLSANGTRTVPINGTRGGWFPTFEANGTTLVWSNVTCATGIDMACTTLPIVEGTEVEIITVSYGSPINTSTVTGAFFSAPAGVGGISCSSTACTANSPQYGYEVENSHPTDASIFYVASYDLIQTGNPLAVSLVAPGTVKVLGAVCESPFTDPNCNWLEHIAPTYDGAHIAVASSKATAPQNGCYPASPACTGNYPPFQELAWTIAPQAPLASALVPSGGEPFTPLTGFNTPSSPEYVGSNCHVRFDSVAISPNQDFALLGMEETTTVGTICTGGHGTYGYVLALVPLPSASITAPAANATISGLAVPFTATCPNCPSVYSAEWDVDGETGFPNAITRTPPYSINYDAYYAGNGSHTIRAIFRDVLNTVIATSPAITVTVENDLPQHTCPPAGTNCTDMTVTAGEVAQIFKGTAVSAISNVISFHGSGAVTQVGSLHSVQNGSAGALTTSSWTPVAGHTIAVYARWQGAGTVTVTDPGGNTYTPIAVQANGTSFSAGWFYVLSAVSFTGRGVTATVSTNTLIDVYAIEIVGASGLDAHVANTGSFPGTAFPTSPVFTLGFPAANEFILAGTTWAGSEAATGTAGYTFTESSSQSTAVQTINPPADWFGSVEITGTANGDNSGISKTFQLFVDGLQKATTAGVTATSVTYVLNAGQFANQAHNIVMAATGGNCPGCVNAAWRWVGGWEQQHTFASGAYPSELIANWKDIRLCVTPSTNCPASASLTASILRSDGTTTSVAAPTFTASTTTNLGGETVPFSVSASGATATVTATSINGAGYITIHDPVTGFNDTVWVYVPPSVNNYPHFCSDGTQTTTACVAPAIDIWNSILYGGQAGFLPIDHADTSTQTNYAAVFGAALGQAFHGFDASILAWGGTIVSHTGTTINGSPNVTLNSGAATANGQGIGGVGIPLNTTVLSGGGTTSIVLSANATANGSVPVTFFQSEPAYDTAATATCTKYVNWASPYSLNLYWTGYSVMTGTDEVFNEVYGPPSGWAQSPLTYWLSHCAVSGATRATGFSGIDEVTSKWQNNPLLGTDTGGVKLGITGGPSQIACTSGTTCTVSWVNWSLVGSNRFIITGSGTNLDYNTGSGTPASYLATKVNANSFTFPTPGGIGTTTYTSGTSPNLLIEPMVNNAFDATALSGSVSGTNSCPPGYGAGSTSAGPCPQFIHYDGIKTLIQQIQAVGGHTPLAIPSLSGVYGTPVGNWCGKHANLAGFKISDYCEGYFTQANTAYLQQYDNLQDLVNGGGMEPQTRLIQASMDLGTPLELEDEATIQDYLVHGTPVSIASCSGQTITLAADYGLRNVLPDNTRISVSGSTNCNGKYYIISQSGLVLTVAYANPTVSGATTGGTITFANGNPWTLGDWSYAGSTSNQEGSFDGVGYDACPNTWKTNRGQTFTLSGTSNSALNASGGVPTFWFTADTLAVCSSSGQGGQSGWRQMANITASTGGTGSVTADNSYIRGRNWPGVSDSETGPRYQFASANLCALIGCAGPRGYSMTIDPDLFDLTLSQVNNGWSPTGGNRYHFDDTDFANVVQGQTNPTKDVVRSLPSWWAHTTSNQIMTRIVPYLMVNAQHLPSPDYGQFYRTAALASPKGNLLLFQSFSDAVTTCTVNLAPYLVTGQPIIRISGNAVGGIDPIAIINAGTTTDSSKTCQPGELRAYIFANNEAAELAEPSFSVNLPDIPLAVKVAVQFGYSPLIFDAPSVASQTLYPTFTCTSFPCQLPVDKTLGTVYARLLFLDSANNVKGYGRQQF